MINDMENKTVVSGIEDLEHGKNSVEMLRYRVNGVAYKLGLIGIVFSILAAFICLNSFQPSTFLVIIKILMNIAIILAGFLFSEQAKNYSKSGSIGLGVLGCVCVARIFWVPLQLLIYYNKFTAAWKEKNAILAANGDTTEIQAKIDSYTKYLGSTIRSEYEGGYAVSWLPHSGNFRGIVAIVFLVLAAVSFLTASYIGYKQSKKLNTYLESLKQEK